MTQAPPSYLGFKPCERCRTQLSPRDLACPGCGLFQYRWRLEQLSQRALTYEQARNFPMAAATWQEALGLLPPASPEAQQVMARMAILGFPAQPLPPSDAGPFVDPGAEDAQEPVGPPRPPDPWPLAIFKTGGSLLLNIPFYAAFFYSWSINPSLLNALKFGTGFLLLILVHEVGHLLAMRHYRLAGGPPIFLPFVGALINLRQAPANAKVEAIVGIGGPVLGTIGALACLLLALYTGSYDLLQLSMLGFIINLFNMLPIPPLDGGRVMAAVSPWTWLVGLGLLLVLIVMWGFHAWLLMVILFFALPRVMDTLRDKRRRTGPYFQISRRSAWSIGIAYAVLTVCLIGLTAYTAQAIGLRI